MFWSMLRNCNELNYTMFREAAYLVKTMSETGTFINKDRQFNGSLLTRYKHFKCACACVSWSFQLVGAPSPNIVYQNWGTLAAVASAGAGGGWPAAASHRLSCRPGHYLLLMAPTQPPTSRAANEPSASFIVPRDWPYFKDLFYNQPACRLRSLRTSVSISGLLNTLMH